MARLPITRAHPYTPQTGVVAGVTFNSERQYRNALARANGYSSWSAQQRAPRVTLTTEDVARLRPSERLARRQALEAAGLMRRLGLSRTEAARRAGTTPAAILRHAGPALTRSPGGRYRALPSDKLFRPLRVLTVKGVLDVDVSESEQASVVGRHWNGVGHFLDTGNDSRLRAFRGQRVAGHELEVDPDVIEDLARAGDLSFEDIYQS